MHIVETRYCPPWTRAEAHSWQRTQAMQRVQLHARMQHLGRSMGTSLPEAQDGDAKKLLRQSSRRREPCLWVCLQHVVRLAHYLDPCTCTSSCKIKQTKHKLQRMPWMTAWPQPDQESLSQHLPGTYLVRMRVITWPSPDQAPLSQHLPGPAHAQG